MNDSGMDATLPPTPHNLTLMPPQTPLPLSKNNSNLSRFPAETPGPLPATPAVVRQNRGSENDILLGETIHEDLEGSENNSKQVLEDNKDKEASAFTLGAADPSPLSPVTVSAPVSNNSNNPTNRTVGETIYSDFSEDEQQNNSSTSKIKLKSPPPQSLQESSEILPTTGSRNSELETKTEVGEGAQERGDSEVGSSWGGELVLKEREKEKNEQQQQQQQLISQREKIREEKEQLSREIRRKILEEAENNHLSPIPQLTSSESPEKAGHNPKNYQNELEKKETAVVETPRERETDTEGRGLGDSSVALGELNFSKLIVDVVQASGLTSVPPRSCLLSLSLPLSLSLSLCVCVCLLELY